MEKPNYLIDLDRLIEEYHIQYKKDLRQLKLEEILKKQSEKDVDKK